MTTFVTFGDSDPGRGLAGRSWKPGKLRGSPESSLLLRMLLIVDFRAIRVSSSPVGLPRLAIQPAVLSPAGTLQQRASLVAGFVTLESGSEPPSGSPWEAWNRAQNDPRDTLGSLESGLE